MWYYISGRALKGVARRAFALSLPYEYSGDRQISAMIHQLRLVLYSPLGT
jgi:hypothetical protein